MEHIEYPLPMDTPLTENLCYGIGPKPITLSWSRLSDWVKCNYRVKLLHQGKKSKLSNARNFLAGKVSDLAMRKALEDAPKDPTGRLLSISKEDMLSYVPELWDKSRTRPPEDDPRADGYLEKNSILKWNGTDPAEDQKNILENINKSLTNLHPILESKLIGRRFIPEFRPKEMPVIGIPGPSGETCYIRLFLAVDCAVQLSEDPTNPDGLGEWGLYDLKTTSTVEYLEKTLPQLVFYDIAFHALTGKRPIEHALWTPLVNPTIRSIHVTDEHRRMVLNWIISYCHGVWAGKDGFTNDETNCYTCPTRAACPKITPPTTKNDQGLSVVHFGDSSGRKLHG